MTTPPASTPAGVSQVPAAASPPPNCPGSDVDEIRSRDLAFARRFLEVHGDPGQRTHYSLPTEQWRTIYGRVEQSTNSTSALLELNPLDNQDQRELDCQELWEFHQRQPLLPGPTTLVPHSTPLAGDSSLPPRAPILKKRKQLVKVDSGSTPKCRGGFGLLLCGPCPPPSPHPGFGASHLAGSRAPCSCGILPSVGCRPISISGLH
ncbi:hypothetical protein C8R41DRAFT_870624 [Lentinula lateritia]|uniref:Uncharacterized protein n=1 Tax=Lentinula lateritia TaxID=40482 RepID=A0ABQ8V3V2_9AGAR|nr:hypothetical protein C8R41DRAFT_870624 [Lentinula lateritia]